ncbi:MAG: LysM domain-containing protein [Capsulimonas sp.]|uniref:LysM peptidoglycan-binding domain-containing protein n=1 Tax=Capsulimonas sp. TaxID=2494211 RepID=UPI003263257C
MGALRIDLCENVAGTEQEACVSAPRLVLTNFEELQPELPKAAPAKTGARSRRAARKRRDGYWLSAVMVTLVMASVGGAWNSLAHSRTELAPETITVTVTPGDSLWKYAKRYGSQDTYILDRVNDLARANSLSSHAALVPGQHLKVTVTNPVELAKLETARETKLARR